MRWDEESSVNYGLSLCQPHGVEREKERVAIFGAPSDTFVP